jgi:four helix bundle protein
MPFKFEKLEVRHVALDYSDLIYEIAGQLPKSEEANLKSQIGRAATSVALNIAESTTSQTDVEKARFLGLALRPVLETVACQHIISRRGFLRYSAPLRQAYKDAMNLAGSYKPCVTRSPQTGRDTRGNGRLSWRKRAR